MRIIGKVPSPHLFLIKQGENRCSERLPYHSSEKVRYTSTLESHRIPTSGTIVLKCALDVRLGKVSADVQQSAAVSPGHFICETIAEIEPCRMDSFSPVLVHLRNPLCRGGGDRDNLKSESFDQAGHLRRYVSPRGDDQHLGQRAGGDQDTAFSFEYSNAGLSLRFIEADRHQRGCINRNHSGIPSSPYRKSWLRAALGPGIARKTPEVRAASISSRRVFAFDTGLIGTSSTAG